jgi:hypothetical protein
MKSYPRAAIAAGIMSVAVAAQNSCRKEPHASTGATALTSAFSAAGAASSAPTATTGAPATTADPCTITFKDPTPDFTEHTVRIEFAKKTLVYDPNGDQPDVIPFAQMQQPEQKAFLQDAAKRHKVPTTCLNGTGL